MLRFDVSRQPLWSALARPRALGSSVARPWKTGRFWQAKIAGTLRRSAKAKNFLSIFNKLRRICLLIFKQSPGRAQRRRSANSRAVSGRILWIGADGTAILALERTVEARSGGATLVGWKRISFSRLPVLRNAGL
jgi:hypothetical protein